MTTALERCVGDTSRFAAQTWGRRPLHRAGGGAFDDLLTLGDVDRILAGMSLRLPLFRLVKDGSPVPADQYTRSGRAGSMTMTGIADPGKVFALFHDGATIVLQSLHRYWEPLARFCRELEIALGHPTQVNAYITPPGSRGLSVHEDAHDVFVLQAFGRKQWEVWEPFADADPDRKGHDGAPMLSVELTPGDCLYMPRGTPHAARTQETLSGHLTVGIPATTWGAVFDDALTAVRRDRAFDEPLPVGFHRDPAGFATQVGERLVDLQRRLEKLDPSDVAEGRIRSFLTSRAPWLRGVLEDVSRLDALGDTTRVRRREGAICELREGDERLVAYLGDRDLTMPAWLGPAMRFVATTDEFEVGDLQPWVGHEGSRLVLVRRLVREGLLRLVAGG